MDRTLVAPEPLRSTGSRSRADVEVAELLRAGLTAARRAGEPFDHAWPAALDQVLAGLHGRELRSWRDVLDGTEPAWRAAYIRERYDGSTAVIALADLIAG